MKDDSGDGLTAEERAECDHLADKLTEIFEKWTDQRECAVQIVGSVASLDADFCLHCLIESLVTGRELATGRWDQAQLEYALRCFARVVAGMLARIPGDAGRAQVTNQFAAYIGCQLQEIVADRIADDPAFRDAEIAASGCSDGSPDPYNP